MKVNENVANATMSEISEYVSDTIDTLTEFGTKKLAQQLRMRYREFSFGELIDRLMRDMNGEFLHPVEKRAMLRVMRNNVSNMFKTVSHTPFGEVVNPLAEIKPIPIKRKSAECLSVIEDVFDTSDVEFDVGLVYNTYKRLNDIVKNDISNITECSIDVLAALVFLEKDGIFKLDSDMKALVCKELRNRCAVMLSDIGNASLDELGAFLSFNVNGVVDMSRVQFNRIGEEIQKKVINLIRKNVHGYSNVRHYATFDEMCTDCVSMIFMQIHSYNPSRAAFSTWVWNVIESALGRDYVAMKANSHVMLETNLSKTDSDKKKFSLENISDSQTLRDYNAICLQQMFDEFADNLRARYPQFRKIITAIFGNGNGVMCDEINYKDISRRSGEDVNTVKNVFESVIRPEFIRLYKAV